MTLRMVGAGLGRTGTHSLKLALEQLTGEPCYHMVEVFGRPDDVATWKRAAEGETPDWRDLFDGYGAAVDWPAAPFFEEIAAAFPDAKVLLSTRADADTWFRSANATIFEPQGDPDLDAFDAMWSAVASLTFDGSVRDRDVATAGYERHNARVRATVPADRLVTYQPGDGWAPLCAALDVPIPDEPFPHTNSTADFRSRAGLDT